jgi:hypothetical protein
VDQEERDFALLEADLMLPTSHDTTHNCEHTARDNWVNASKLSKKNLPKIPFSTGFTLQHKNLFVADFTFVYVDFTHMFLSLARA